VPVCGGDRRFGSPRTNYGCRGAPGRRNTPDPSARRRHRSIWAPVAAFKRSIRPPARKVPCRLTALPTPPPIIGLYGPPHRRLGRHSSRPRNRRAAIKFPALPSNLYRPNGPISPAELLTLHDLDRGPPATMVPCWRGPLADLLTALGCPPCTAGHDPTSKRLARPAPPSCAGPLRRARFGTDGLAGRACFPPIWPMQQGCCMRTLAAVASLTLHLEQAFPLRLLRLFSRASATTPTTVHRSRRLCFYQPQPFHTYQADHAHHGCPCNFAPL